MCLAALGWMLEIYRTDVEDTDSIDDTNQLNLTGLQS